MRFFERHSGYIDHGKTLTSIRMVLNLFFTSNALICALLTFKYLSARDISFEKIVCNPILNEVVENNEGLKYEIKAFNENCKKIYNRNDRWEEKIKEELFGKDAYIEQLEDFLYTNNFSLKVPSTYIFFSQEKKRIFWHR